MERKWWCQAAFILKKCSYDYAITWLQRAGNYPQALYVLGALYLKQPHLAPDSNEKARLYFMQSRTSIACHNLGNIYNNGVGVPRDKQEALKWFVQGGLQGLRRSKYEAGLIYFQDAHKSRESAKLAYYWFKSALKKKKKSKNDDVAKSLRGLVKILDYDIESLAMNYKPYPNLKRVHTIQDNHEDDDESSNNDDSGGEMGTQPNSSALAASKNNNNMAQAQSSFIFPSNSPSSFMSASNNMLQPESSSMTFYRHNNIIQTSSPFMAATNDTIQSQSSFIPLCSNMFRPETSFMAASNNKMTQQKETARIKQLENENTVYKCTIERLRDKLSRHPPTEQIQKLERGNNDLKKAIDVMEKLFYWVA